VTELDHNWNDRPKRQRITGTLSIRLPKPEQPANDDHDEPRPAA
jgi:hypothetical protein